MPPVHLAVPEKHFGLTLFLVFFDRCGNCGLASSATGGARPQFPSRDSDADRRKKETRAGNILLQLPPMSYILALFI